MARAEGRQDRLLQMAAENTVDEGQQTMSQVIDDAEVVRPTREWIMGALVVFSAIVFCWGLVLGAVLATVEVWRVIT